MDFRKMAPTEFADVDIEPTFELERTAQILAEIFGGLEFKKDDGRYEEFPAYVARDDESGIKFAILGIPDPKYDYREDKSSDDHYLIVEPIRARDGAYTVDISEAVASFINSTGRLKARAT